MKLPKVILDYFRILSTDKMTLASQALNPPNLENTQKKKYSQYQSKCGFVISAKGGLLHKY